MIEETRMNIITGDVVVKEQVVNVVKTYYMYAIPRLELTRSASQREAGVQRGKDIAVNGLLEVLRKFVEVTAEDYEEEPALLMRAKISLPLIRDAHIDDLEYELKNVQYALRHKERKLVEVIANVELLSYKLQQAQRPWYIKLADWLGE